MATIRFAGLIAALLLVLFVFDVQAQPVKQRTKSKPTKVEILEAEQRLSDLGYWTGPIDGAFDAVSRHALVAFQKVEGRERTGRFTNKELISDSHVCRN